jgi:hypothetical protein
LPLRFFGRECDSRRLHHFFESFKVLPRLAFSEPISAGFLLGYKFGVLQSFLGYVNFARLGYTTYGLFLSTQRMGHEEDEEFIAFLTAYPYCTYLCRSGSCKQAAPGLLLNQWCLAAQLIALDSPHRGPGSCSTLSRLNTTRCVV